jgi:hypothetical protein
MKGVPDGALVEHRLRAGQLAPPPIQRQVFPRLPQVGLQLGVKLLRRLCLAEPQDRVAPGLDAFKSGADRLQFALIERLCDHGETPYFCRKSDSSSSHAPPMIRADMEPGDSFFCSLQQ